MKIHKRNLIKLINAGKLSIETLDFYHKLGFIFVIEDGKVVNMVDEVEHEMSNM